jgi:predicted nucleotidyltransferase
MLQPNMGKIMPKMGLVADDLVSLHMPTARRAGKSRTGLADTLFSAVQQRVLALLFGQPERSFYTAELIRLAGSGSGAVQRELARLEQSGLVTTQRTGNQKHYRANRQSPIFSELRSIVQKTVGLAVPLGQALEPYRAKIGAAFVYGSVAKGEDTAGSDIDLMVIGENLTYSDLYGGLQAAERVLDRTINPTFMTPSEWRKKRRQSNSFVSKISAQPKLFVFGSDDHLSA